MPTWTRSVGNAFELRWRQLEAMAYGIGVSHTDEVAVCRVCCSHDHFGVVESVVLAGARDRTSVCSPTGADWSCTYRSTALHPARV